MNDYFPDNFVDYNDPPLSSTDFTSDQKEFSLPSPNSDSTGNFQISYSPKGLGNYPESDQLNFDLMSYYNQQQEVPVQNQVPETSKKGSRKKAKPAATPAYTEISNEISNEASPDNKILDKSKRIQKREIAKERTKQKLDIATLFQGVDKKFLPEGYDDPNLDERSKKKMIQMVRNRISAQNSRDRKKGYMSQLEEQNAQLEEDIARITEERDRLATELQSAQDEIQILRSRGGQGCANCQPILKEDDFIVTGGDIEQNVDDIPAGGFSGLASPRLMRFGSSKASLFGLFAFTCFIGMIAFSNIGEQGFTMQGNGLTKLHGRNLAAEPAEKVLKEKTLVLQNIQEIMSNFQDNSELTFKTYLHKNRIFSGMTIQESMKMLKNSVIDAKANKNAIVEYSETRANNLRRNDVSVISNNAPALTYSNGSPLHSTLFCNSGYEFYSEGSQDVHRSSSGDIVPNTSLALEKAEYLQLLVPKATIIKSNVNGNLIRDIYGQPIITDNNNDDTMYEIWCKVFMVREIGSSAY